MDADIETDIYVYLPQCLPAAYDKGVKKPLEAYVPR